MRIIDSAVGMLKDIRFWILAFFILHLSAITLPPFEPGSTWRQTDGLAIARNFYERSSNIFYPTVDVAGEKSGIIGCEFPILNYLIYLLSCIFGYESWYGRLINLVVSSAGVFFFYRLIRDAFDESSARNASLILMASVWFTYNRTNIPDTFGASLCMMSLYYGIQYLQRGKYYQLALYFSFGLIGCLSKISAVCILSVMAIPFFLGDSSRFSKVLIVVASVLILGLVYTWYFQWVPYLNTSFGFEGHFFMGMSLTEGAQQLIDDWPHTLKRFYDTAFKYVGFIAFLVGLYLVIRKKQWLALAIFLVPFLAFLAVIVKAGFNFNLNPYYVIMFIPPMAFLAGWGLAQFRANIVVFVVLLAIGIEGVANQLHVFTLREPYKSLDNLEAVMDTFSKRDDLIAMNATAFADPTPMYAAHRRGWVVTNDVLAGTNYISYLESHKCRFVVIVKKISGDVTLPLPTVYDSDFYKIYRIPSGTAD